MPYRLRAGILVGVSAGQFVASTIGGVCIVIGAQDYQGCKTIVYDDASQTIITEATIETFEKTNCTVTLRSRAFLNNAYERVTLLIFYKGVPHEYKGTVRKAKTASGQTQIALYRGKVNEKRTSARFPLSMHGVVTHLIIAHKLMALPTPTELEVVNISTNGCMLRGKPNALNIGTAFQLSINMLSADILINAKVVRSKAIDAQTVEFGCILLFEL